MYTVWPPDSRCTRKQCGDGAINLAGEACDDGNILDLDGCSSNCSVELGYICEHLTFLNVNFYPPVMTEVEICDAFVVRADFGACSLASRCHVHGECVIYQHTEFCNCKVGFSVTGEGGTNPEIFPRGTSTDNPLLDNASLSLEGGHTCQDVDECTTSLENPCRENAACINTEGSFECLCNQGFTQVLDGRGYFAGCEDVDECADKGNPVCAPDSGSCFNSLGSYSCSCKLGFNGSGFLSRDGCMDLDECAANTHGCGVSQICRNTMGSFLCDCMEPGTEPLVENSEVSES